MSLGRHAIRKVLKTLQASAQLAPLASPWHKTLFHIEGGGPC